MAVDKLVDSAQLNADLTTVANAIRTKCGTSEQLSFPSGMATAIAAIPSGASVVTGIVTLQGSSATIPEIIGKENVVLSLKLNMNNWVNLTEFTDKAWEIYKIPNIDSGNTVELYFEGPYQSKYRYCGMVYDCYNKDTGTFTPYHPFIYGLYKYIAW